MKAVHILITTLIAGGLSAETQPMQAGVLDNLFDHWVSNSEPLDPAYFAYRLEGSPSKSTLYRFNLTDGTLVNPEEKLKPVYDKEHCYADGNDSVGYDSATCSLDFEGLKATYIGIFSHGSKSHQTFNITVEVIKLHHGSHMNPALLAGFAYNNSWCKSEKCVDCKLTEFSVTGRTSPAFQDFTDKDGRPLRMFPNETAVQSLWKDFQVKLYTDVKPIIRRTLLTACQTELRRRWSELGSRQ